MAPHGAPVLLGTSSHGLQQRWRQPDRLDRRALGRGELSCPRRLISLSSLRSPTAEPLSVKSLCRGTPASTAPFLVMEDDLVTKS